MSTRLDTVIKGGTIVTADETYRADIGIAASRIAAIGLELKGEETIDATGKYVMPGGLDVHTHLEMPFGGTVTADDWQSGTTAAACGGTTTLIDFAIQDFDKSLHAGVEAWFGRAEGKAAIDYAFHTIIRDLKESHLKEMDALVDEGITSFKLFMAYPGVFMVDDATIFKAMLRTRDNGGLICMHAENGGVIDTLVHRALAEGHTEPKWHALTRADECRSRGNEARDRALRNGGRARLYRAPLRGGRDGGSAPREGAWSSRFRRNLPPNTFSCPMRTTSVPTSREPSS